MTEHLQQADLAAKVELLSSNERGFYEFHLA